MKKKILISCLFVFTSVIAFAQLPNFNLGLKAGVNLAKLSTDFANEENRLGYQVGAWARIGAAGFYVQPEAYLGGKNNEFAFDESGNRVEGKANFTTLDVPVLLGTKIGPNKFNVRFMAGPVISFVVDKNTTFKSASAAITDADDYKNQTWGGQIGAGVDLGNLAVDLRYEAGLSNIHKTSKYDQKQNLWHLSLGYKLF
jgi:hypothetical protein